MTTSTSSSVLSIFSTSIGRKQIMAITGLLLIGFLGAHLAGNFLLMVGADAFNEYAHRLISLGPALYVAEAGLVILFLAHFLMAMKLIVENRNARPERYYMSRMTGRGATFASRTMPFTGVIILIFLVLHILQFKYGPYYSTYLNGQEVRDLYRTVLEYFANPWATAWYVFAMTALAIHLSHGFQSSFQSLGLSHPRYNPLIKKIGLSIAILFSLGFAAISVYMHLQN